MTDARLTVAIATTADRLARMNLGALPVIEGVRWHLFVQGADEGLAALPSRADLAFTATKGRGAARNRNAALDHLHGGYLLFGDDDLTFHPEGITTLIAAFAVMPEADILCARLADETGRPRKRYSPHGTRLRWFNSAKIGTPEIALRLSAPELKRLRFDPGFGAGQADWLGDEFIFLCDALRAGLRGRHVDITVASHPAESSGTQWGAGAAAVRRRVFIRALGRWPSLPVRLVFALRHRARLRGLGDLWALLRP